LRKNASAGAIKKATKTPNKLKRSAIFSPSTLVALPSFVISFQLRNAKRK
jgi:hypothetical protein